MKTIFLDRLNDFKIKADAAVKAQGAGLSSEQAQAMNALQLALLQLGIEVSKLQEKANLPRCVPHQEDS